MSGKTEWRAEKHPKFDVWRVVGDGMTISGFDKPTAHRIAAVNEMMEALEWANGVIGFYSKDPAPDSGISKIRAALAKARGDQ